MVPRNELPTIREGIMPLLIGTPAQAGQGPKSDHLLMSLLVPSTPKICKSVAGFWSMMLIRDHASTLKRCSKEEQGTLPTKYGAAACL